LPAKGAKLSRLCGKSRLIVSRSQQSQGCRIADSNSFLWRPKREEGASRLGAAGQTGSTERLGKDEPTISSS
jgi:hypothetical protein